MKLQHTTLLFNALLAGLVLISCSKDDDNNNGGTVQLTNTADLSVSKAFDWSASVNDQLQLSFTNPENISIENEQVHLENASGVVLAKAVVQNNTVTFNLQLPQDADYYLYMPSSNDRVQIKGGGAQSVELGSNTAGKRKAQNKTNEASCTVCDSPFENGKVELPVIPNTTYRIVNESTVPGWETTASDNKIELWSSGFNGVPAQEGRQFFEINANRTAALYQELCLEPGSTIKWSVYHRGRAGVDVAAVKIGGSVATATLQATMTDGTNAWGYYTGNYVIPANQTTTFFVFEAISTASGNNSIGNFLDNFRINCDQDGDGIVDEDDDFPTDPTRAYRSFFPTAGKQLVAFEDLWPSTGDYDFNDLILSTKADIVRNANNELIEAHVKVSIDAIGAGINNGIAMMLYNSSKLAFGSNVISSVTGDASLDAQNANGLVLSNNVITTISEYYQNNGVGPTRDPDTLKFTINFAAGTTGDFVLEPYLFRTDNRGHEVHMAGYPATNTIDNALVNTAEDDGDFKTASGLPWAIEIITETGFQHPTEKNDILLAYPSFQTWATSLGQSEANWYTSPVGDFVFGN